jgi:hypothetical protein
MTPKVFLGLFLALLLAGCADRVVTRTVYVPAKIPAAFLDCGAEPVLTADPASAGDLGFFGYRAIGWGQGCAWRLFCLASWQAGADECKVADAIAAAEADAREK